MYTQIQQETIKKRQIPCAREAVFQRQRPTVTRSNPYKEGAGVSFRTPGRFLGALRLLPLDGAEGA